MLGFQCLMYCTVCAVGRKRWERNKISCFVRIQQNVNDGVLSSYMTALFKTVQKILASILGPSQFKKQRNNPTDKERRGGLITAPKTPQTNVTRKKSRFHMWLSVQEGKMKRAEALKMILTALVLRGSSHIVGISAGDKQWDYCQHYWCDIGMTE